MSELFVYFLRVNDTELTIAERYAGDPVGYAQIIARSLLLNHPDTDCSLVFREGKKLNGRRWKITETVVGAWKLSELLS